MEGSDGSRLGGRDKLSVELLMGNMLHWFGLPSPPIPLFLICGTVLGAV